MITNCNHYSLYRFEEIYDKISPDETFLVRFSNPGQELRSTNVPFPMRIDIPIYDQMGSYLKEQKILSHLIKKISSLHDDSRNYRVVSHCNAGLSRSQTLTSFIESFIIKTKTSRAKNPVLYKTLVDLWTLERSDNDCKE